MESGRSHLNCGHRLDTKSGREPARPRVDGLAPLPGHDHDLERLGGLPAP
jgi:hypothetical protein